MYLFHESSAEFYTEILESKFLFPSSKTKNENYNILDSFLTYIFFCCCERKRLENLGPFTFVFPINILYDRSFYTNISHAAANLNSSTYYKKNTPMKEINFSLKKLYNQSIQKESSLKLKQDYLYFKIFQEIFFKKSVSINDAIFLVLPHDISKQEVASIKERFPNLKLLLKKVQ